MRDQREPLIFEAVDFCLAKFAAASAASSFAADKFLRPRSSEFFITSAAASISDVCRIWSLFSFGPKIVSSVVVSVSVYSGQVHVLS